MKVLTQIRSALILAFIAFAPFAPSAASAHPVTFQGATSLMSWNSPMMSDQWISYSATSHFAVTARYLAYRDADRHQAFYFGQANALVKRWNEDDSQANIYLSAGYGAETTRSELQGALLGALETDWESRRYYVSAKLQDVHTQEGELPYLRFRAGFAPYLAKFTELNTWLILQLERQPQFASGLVVTPTVRLFYQNMLWEVGANQDGQVAFNFMVHL